MVTLLLYNPSCSDFDWCDKNVYDLQNEANNRFD